MANEPVFELIKTLDKNEKGYFKKFTSRYGEKTAGSDYLKLFDAIDKMEVYDERKLKQLLQSGSKKTNLSAQKKYLYDQILRSLRLYSSGKSVSYNITERLLDIHILMDKNMNDLANEMLDDTLSKAIKQDNSELCLQLLLVKDTLLLRNIGQHLPQEITRNKERIFSIIQTIKEENELGVLLYNIKQIDDSRGRTEVFTQQQLDAADAIKNHPLVKYPEQKSRRARLTIYATLHLYSSIVGKDADALKYMQLRHNEFQEMELDVKTTHSYLANISNIIMMALNINKVNDALQFLNTLHKVTFRDKHLEVYRQKLYAKNLLMYTMVKSLTGITLQEVESTEKSYLDTKPQMSGNNNLMSAYYLAVLYYTAGDKGKSIEWLQHTIDHTNTAYINVQAYARLLQGFIYYEMEFQSLSKSALQAAQYFVKKHNIKSVYLRNLTSMLSKLQSISLQGELKQFYSVMHAEIQTMYDTELNNEITYFHDFNMLIWLEAKVRNVSYSDVLTKANKENSTIAAGM